MSSTPKTQGEYPCQSFLRSAFLSVLIPHTLLILGSIFILKLVLKKSMRCCLYAATSQASGFGLRVPKRGLMGSSSGKSEINGQKSKERKAVNYGHKTLGPSFRSLPLAPTNPRNQKAQQSLRVSHDWLQPKDFEKFSTRRNGMGLR